MPGPAGTVRATAVSVAFVVVAVLVSLLVRPPPAFASSAPTITVGVGEVSPEQPVLQNESSGPAGLVPPVVRNAASALWKQAERLDFISDDYLDPGWKWMIGTFGAATTTILLTFLWHEVLYFGCWLPWLLLDQIPAMRKYKIQPGVKNDWKTTWFCIKHLLVAHVCIQIPMMFIFYFLAMSRLGMTAEGQFPKVSELLWQIPLFFVLEDFYFYWIHRWMHHPSIYAKIHKVHHEFKAPFGIAAEYAHPVETLVLGIGFFIGPLFYCKHLGTLWVWLAVRLWETIEDHSGYDIPWNPTNFIPFWAGANHHDHHHKTFKGNYASVFVWWDWVFGTDVQWRHPSPEKVAREAKRRAAALSKDPVPVALHEENGEAEAYGEAATKAAGMGAFARAALDWFLGDEDPSDQGRKAFR